MIKNLQIKLAIAAVTVLSVLGLGLPGNADPTTADNPVIAGLQEQIDALSGTTQLTSDRLDAVVETGIDGDLTLETLFDERYQKIEAELAKMAADLQQVQADVATSIGDLDILVEDLANQALASTDVQERAAALIGDVDSWSEEIAELSKLVENNRKLINRNSTLVIGDHVAKNPYEGHRQEHLLSVDP